MVQPPEQFVREWCIPCLRMYINAYDAGNNELNEGLMIKITSVRNCENRWVSSPDRHGL